MCVFRRGRRSRLGRCVMTRSRLVEASRSRRSRDSRQPAAWALAEATAANVGAAGDPVRDLDLEVGTVWIAGSTKTEPRSGSLSRVGCRCPRSTRRHPSSEGIAGHAASSTRATVRLESRQASGCAAISETLRRAGLARRTRCAAGLGRGVGWHADLRGDGTDRGGCRGARRAQSRSRRPAHRLGLDDAKTPSQ